MRVSTRCGRATGNNFGESESPRAIGSFRSLLRRLVHCLWVGLKGAAVSTNPGVDESDVLVRTPEISDFWRRCKHRSEWNERGAQRAAGSEGSKISRGVRAGRRPASNSRDGGAFWLFTIKFEPQSTRLLSLTGLLGADAPRVGVRENTPSPGLELAETISLALLGCGDSSARPLSRGDHGRDSWYSKPSFSCRCRGRMTPSPGLEPGTTSLTARCSTI